MELDATGKQLLQDVVEARETFHRKRAEFEELVKRNPDLPFEVVRYAIDLLREDWAGKAVEFTEWCISSGFHKSPGE